jgi:DNA-binding beta-propeller fold protein YncE
VDSRPDAKKTRDALWVVADLGPAESREIAPRSGEPGAAAESRTQAEISIKERGAWEGQRDIGMKTVSQSAGTARVACIGRNIACAIACTVVVACGGGSGNSSAPPPVPGNPLPQPPTGSVLPGPRPVAEAQTFVAFESGPVRPLALSADGEYLFAVNTPDNRLEIFSTNGTLQPSASVPVGLEPVAVAVDPAGRVWVVNHLSDSISIIDVNRPVPALIQTLWVGDEPRDIVFAGSGRERAFITTAHRGQNSPVDAAMNTPGVGRADVWVFDSASLDDTPGGAAEAILTLFGDRPRPLAVSADGLRVFAGIFLSGNRTTSIGPNNFAKSPPTASADGVAQPDTGLIVRFDGINWIDADGNVRNSFVPFTLPDYDVFEIDAVTLAELRRISGVGTVLFNMVVNPVDDTVYVSNINSRNHVRFSGRASRGHSTIRGHVTDQQITVIGPARDVQMRQVNKHLDFSSPVATGSDRDLSLSTLLGMAISQDGRTLYAAAFGSGKIALFDTVELDDDSFVPDAQHRILLSAGGPAGIVLDEGARRGFVLTRFDNGISTIDLDTLQETGHVVMFNSEPAAITAGRRFLYDATATSGNGNDSCASCHIFGDTDGLAWDLGDPDRDVSPIPNTFISISPADPPYRFHPMKGPMTTQSMRGLRGHGPMHWRGDRTGVNRAANETLEEAAFKEFNEAFDAFMGLGREIDNAEMQAFTDFAMRINYPPNPIRQLDNSLSGIELDGESLYLNGVVRVQTGVREVCAQCHPIDFVAGVYGSRGLSANNSQPGEKNFKIPHFRDQYQKVGMFGWGFQSPPETGPQIRGFSFNHNGATSSNFIIADLGMPQNELLALRAFLYAFPTESPPILGQQVTLTDGNRVAAMPRIDLLIERGRIDMPIPECDLVVKGVIGGEQRGWSMRRSGQFRSDRGAESAIDRSALEALITGPGEYLTFTCAPWGSGVRIGIDRDLDGVFDGDE